MTQMTFVTISADPEIDAWKEAEDGGDINVEEEALFHCYHPLQPSSYPQ